MNNDAVFLVDNDEDDHELVQQVFSDLKINNTLRFFKSGKEVLDYLKENNETPFIVISDINLGGMDGFELREALMDDPSLKYKVIPFIFWSTAASKQQIKRAYDAGGHGFFIKETNYTELRKSLKNIMEYWLKSKTPF